ncbi:hypothetical protein G6F24_018476 [Rhizopus arrhizus]|nr:hypothetical protein G6F24_018476 [Rhizopus arrhizus]
MPDAPFTANARSVGSRQGDAIRNITGSAGAVYRSGEAIGTGALRTAVWGDSPAKLGVKGGDPGDNATIALDASSLVPTASENRPINLALAARLHV